VAELEVVIEELQRALRAFAKGDPEPVKAAFSHSDDVVLANPFGPAVRGWQRVADSLDYASSRFREGDVTSFETIGRYIGPDLATIHDVERWQAKVGDDDELSSFDLRVTSTYRREGGGWKLAHRHADPIATQDPRGPLRDR
jgi:ketosteroid isomerase-like protein